MFEGIFGLLVLAGQVWAGFNVVQSQASTLGKILWVVFIVFLPVLSFVAWLLVGPRKAERI